MHDMRISLSEEYLFDKYSTGQIYVSPAAVDYADSELKAHYWCAGPIESVLEDYGRHLVTTPTLRCNSLPKIKVMDGCLRDLDNTLTTEEKDWLWLEYKLRAAIVSGVKSSKISFVVVR